MIIMAANLPVAKKSPRRASGPINSIETTILHELRPSMFSYHNSLLKCTPAIIMGRNPYLRKGDTSRALGIAVYGDIDKEPIFYHWSTQHELVRCYRALQLLSRSTIISEDTLCACFYAMNCTSAHDETQHHYVDILRNDGLKNITDIKKDILSQKIPDIELDHALHNMQINNVKPNLNELFAEISAGRINQTPGIIQTLISYNSVKG